MTVKQALSSTDAQIHSPVAGTVGFTPAVPTTNALLTASPTGFTDPDNDALTYTYKWSVNGTAVTGATSQTFDLSKPGQGDHGQQVSVDVTAVDPAGHKSATVTGSVTIGNSVPTPGSVAITPSAPKAGDTLKATPAGFTDVDGDTFTYEYQWLVKGKIVDGATGATFSPTTAVNGDLVSVAVAARDSLGAVGLSVSDIVTMGNTPPTRGSVAIAPFSPKAGTVLTAIPSGFADVDGDSLTYQYQWTVNDKDIPGATAASLLQSPAVGGDVVSVTVSADDGHQGGTSEAARASVTIVNTPPDKGSVAISPSSPQAGTALTATPTGFADADRDALSYQYAWFYNGQQIAGATGATLAGSAVTAGEIRVDVRATDAHGGASDAATVTVIASNPPETDKDAPTIAIMAPRATTYALGDELVLSYRCTDSSGVASCTATLGRTGAKPVGVVSGQKVRLSQTGSFVLQITAKDRNGNSGSTALQFSVADKLAPKIAISSPKSTTYRVGQRLLVTFACTDAAGIASYNATLGRVGTKAVKVTSGKKVTLSRAGRYVLKVTAKDRNGNATTKTLKFSVKQ